MSSVNRISSFVYKPVPPEEPPIVKLSKKDHGIRYDRTLKFVIVGNDIRVQVFGSEFFSPATPNRPEGSDFRPNEFIRELEDSAVDFRSRGCKVNHLGIHNKIKSNLEEILKNSNVIARDNFSGDIEAIIVEY